jgi:hypothetical protein
VQAARFGLLSVLRRAVTTVEKVLMKIDRLSFALCCAAALTTLPTAARAAKYIITYKGTVSSGTDQTGVFGAANTDLAGKAFKAVYTLDDATPGVETIVGPSNSLIRGGTYYPGKPASPLSATITIDGITKSSKGSYAGFATQSNDVNGMDFISHDSQDYSGLSGPTFISNYIYIQLSSSTNNFLSNSDFRSKLNYTILPGDRAIGGFAFSMASNAQPFPPVRIPIEQAAGYLLGTSVSIRALGVPEPASWALMILGFGAIGGTMRGQTRGRKEMAQ